MWTNLKPISLSKIRLYPFPENKYFKEVFDKTQIVLHHTISGPSIDGDVSTWIDCKDRVATAIIIARDGTPFQLFSSKYWAYHLGTGNHNQDKRSIGIEIDSWGGLTPGTGLLKAYRIESPKYYIPWSLKITDPDKYYTYYGNAVDVPMQYYPNGFRGYQYFEKYTDAQIQTVGELLLLWRNNYGIPLNYKEYMFDYCSCATEMGKPGVWSHTSFRKTKSDVHPQPELIEMLKTIQNI